MYMKNGNPTKIIRRMFNRNSLSLGMQLEAPGTKARVD